VPEPGAEKGKKYGCPRSKAFIWSFIFSNQHLKPPIIAYFLFEHTLPSMPDSPFKKKWGIILYWSIYEYDGLIDRNKYGKTCIWYFRSVYAIHPA
jgi:hypothetical protein